MTLAAAGLVAELQRTDLGLLSLIDAEHKELRLAASRGLSEEYLQTNGRLPLGVGPCGLAIERHEPVVIADVQTDPRFARFQSAARTGGYQAMCCSPLLTRAGEVIGTVSVYFREPRVGAVVL